MLHSRRHVMWLFTILTCLFLTSASQAQQVCSPAAVTELEERIAMLEKQRAQIEQQIAEAKAALRDIRKSDQKTIDLNQYGKPVYTRIKNGELRVMANQKVIYILKNDRPKSYRLGGSLLSTSFKTNEGVIDSTAGYYEINGQVEQLYITSITPDILKIQRETDGSHTYTFADGGIAEIEVKLSGISTTIEIPVIELPIQKGMTVDQVIEKLGLPTRKEKHYIGWPDSEWHDGIFYTTRIDHRGVSVEHWEYDTYPRAVIAVQDGLVTDAGYKGKAISWGSKMDDDPEWQEYTHWRESPVE